MEDPAAGYVESSYPPNHPPNLTFRYLIAPEEIVADRSSQLRRSRRRHVSKCLWNDNVVAVKILSDDALVDTLVDRIQTWRSLRHPHVLQVLGISLVDDGPSSIVSQYHSDSDVKEFLAKNPSADRAKIVFECALGMQYLHERDLVHGGLNPTNILIDDNGQTCITDYDMVEIEASQCASAHQYFSPEAWKGIISKPSDVFAFAMNSYEVFMSRPPWGGLPANLVYQLIIRGDERPGHLDLDLERKHGLTDQIWDIMVAAWQTEAKLRPTFIQIIKLWERVSDGNNLAPSQSNLLPSSAAGSSIHLPQGVNLNESQRIQDNVIAWQSTQNSSQDSDAMSVLSVPPAYHNLSTKRHPPQLLSPPGSGSDQTNDAGPSIKSVGNPNGLRSGRRLPETPRNEHSPFPSTSASLDNRASSEALSRFSYLSVDSSFTAVSPQHARLSSIDETVSRTLQNRSYERLQPAASGIIEQSVHNGSPGRPNERQPNVQRVGMSDTQSIKSNSKRGAADANGQMNAVLLACALHFEVVERRTHGIVDDYLDRVLHLCSHSHKEAQKLITAGIIPTFILLLKARAVDEVGLELVLITLGALACDPITTNTIYKTKMPSTLIELLSSSYSDKICALSAWCIHRICRSSEAATGLTKEDLGISLLAEKGLRGNLILSRSSAWCLGILAFTHPLAQVLASHSLITASVEHLRRVTGSPCSSSDDICAALYFIARMSRSVELSKDFIRAGSLPLIVHHLSTSENSQVLQWSARAVGCLIRLTVGNDIVKALIEAGSVKALARLPRVIQHEVAEPLASFAFAIQRFSDATWGAMTLKPLMQAGVVDSLLAALRISTDVACPSLHIELALAVSSLSDLGGKSIRREIVKAGGVDILRRVSAAGKAEVAKACNLAVTSITGNIWTRNTASGKAAALHNWDGGCPEYQPVCPLTLNAM